MDDQDLGESAAVSSGTCGRRIRNQLVEQWAVAHPQSSLAELRRRVLAVCRCCCTAVVAAQAVRAVAGRARAKRYARRRCDRPFGLRAPTWHGVSALVAIS